MYRILHPLRREQSGGVLAPDLIKIELPFGACSTFSLAGVLDIVIGVELLVTTAEGKDRVVLVCFEFLITLRTSFW